MLRLAAIAILTAMVAAAQGTSFEVAEIRVHDTQDTATEQSYTNGRMIFRNIPLSGIIASAWDLRFEAMSAPDWVGSARYDIIAKAAPDTPIEAAKVMLRNLLMERMKLVVHTEPLPRQVFVLTVAKRGSKLKPSGSVKLDGECKPESCTRAFEVPPELTKDGGTCKTEVGTGSLIRQSCTHITMAALAGRMPAMSHTVDHAVVDETGLAGEWDFTLQRAPSNSEAAPGELPFFDALERQVGLKLTAAKRNVPVLVVDSVEREPSGE
jgi:uncharacterized protein (TIGR03435 family)